MIAPTQSHLEVGLVAQSQDLLFVAEIWEIALVPRRPEVSFLRGEDTLWRLAFQDQGPLPKAYR